MPYKQSHPITAFREQPFSLRDTSNNPVTGATFSGTDLQLCKPGGTSFANCANQASVVEIGGGNYKYIYSTGELDTPGQGGIFKVKKAGAVQVEYSVEVDRAYFTTVVSGTLAANSFPTDRSETTDNHFKDALLRAISGALLGQVKKIGGYTGSSKTISIAPGQAFTSAPAVGDIFELING